MIVVARADRVDVGGFHQRQVLDPVGLSQREAAVRPEIMPADAGAFDRYAVPKHDVVLDLDLLESKSLLDPFHEFVVADQ